MRVCVLALAVLVALSASFVVEASAQEVRVTLRDVEPRTGKILASLQTQDQFLRGRGVYSAMVDPPARKGEVTLVFTGVAPGDYAFSAMHDENGDYQMAMQPSGMPAEGYAMSNGGMMAGPPTWEAAKFTVAAQPVAMTETLFYPWVPPAR